MEESARDQHGRVANANQRLARDAERRVLKAYREGLARGVADLLPESRIVVKQLAQSLDVPLVRLFEIGLENEGPEIGCGVELL